MRILAAGAIVHDADGRLLVVRRSRPPQQGAWTVPGGKCERGESASVACIRECAEETGLIVQIVRFAGRVCRHAGGEDYVIDDFLCRVAGGTLRAGDDATEARWVDRAEFDQLDLVEGLSEALAGWTALPR